MVHSVCSHTKGVYNLSAFILHAASLHQGCPHCARFLVAATRRCQDRVSVPMWLIILSDQLAVLALVRFYHTNKLIASRLILERIAALVLRHLRYYSEFPRAIPNSKADNLLVTHPFAASFKNASTLKARSTCMPKARRQRSS